MAIVMQSVKLGGYGMLMTAATVTVSPVAAFVMTALVVAGVVLYNKPQLLHIGAPRGQNGPSVPQKWIEGLCFVWKKFQ
ncbi:hypothetical protein DPEC_G00285760 [Dallia pectoralis]|uniref:Uncharacterized protein n=1 Tax=Dallia pectoralis TaxID=75939 RepID=A0ACC2FJW2_DALPE|nr:hypothetical protein DPEC_G00285760 [Dallia pectoralis]